VSKADEERAKKLKEEFDRWLPPKKTEAERERERNEFTDIFVQDVLKHARLYHTNRRGGGADPDDMRLLTGTQQLGLGVSYRGEEPPPQANDAVLRVLHEEPGGYMDETLTAEGNALMEEVFRLSLEAFNGELEASGAQKA
jgi:hypothetical protein